MYTYIYNYILFIFNYFLMHYFLFIKYQINTLVHFSCKNLQGKFYQLNTNFYAFISIIRS